VPAISYLGTPSAVARALLALGVGAVAGCGDPTAPLRPADVVGTYALASIGGRPLPTPELASSEYTYAADGTWTSREVYPARDPGAPPTVNTAPSGVWALDPRRSTLRRTNTAARGVSVLEFRVEERGRVLVGVFGTSGAYRYVKRP